jgi:tetratricopeptide (TPR) repeat protein
LQHFDAALALDRTFAPAWIGIAGTYSNMAFYAFAKWTDVLPTALRAITTAIEFDRTSALSHCVLAQIQLAQWDVVGAQRSLETAGNLDAGCAGVYQLSSFIDMWRGETELAVANAKRTVALVPSDIAAHGTFANALAAQGDFQNAIESYSKILEVDPCSRIARQGRCEAYAADRQLHLAIGDLERPADASKCQSLGLRLRLFGGQAERIPAVQRITEKVEHGIRGAPLHRAGAHRLGPLR